MSSATQMRKMDFAPPAFLRSYQKRCVGVGIVLGVLAVVGVFTNRTQFFHSYLIGFMWCLGPTLGSMAILMIYHLTGGTWGVVIRRILEAGIRTLPLMAVLFVPLILGVPYLYSWAHPEQLKEEHLKQMAAGYLSLKYFILRGVIYFAIWGLMIRLLGQWSDRQERDASWNPGNRFQAVSGPGLFIYAWTITLGTTDWVMSLNPAWSSAIYGMLFMVGQGLSALCLAVIVSRLLLSDESMKEVLKPKGFHDLGNLSLAFVMLWAYFNFSQWLIIWSGNLPDEIHWYLVRINGGWGRVAVLLAAGHFAVPFALLLSRSLKRNPQQLVWLSLWLIFMRLVDLIWHVEPTYAARVGDFSFSWQDLVVSGAMMSWWLAFFFFNLGRRSLIPVNDPNLQGVLGESHG